MNLHKRLVTSMARFLSGQDIHIQRVRGLVRNGLVRPGEDGWWDVAPGVAQAFVARYGCPGPVLHHVRRLTDDQKEQLRAGIYADIAGAEAPSDLERARAAGERRLRESAARAEARRSAPPREARGPARPKACRAVDQGTEGVAVPGARQPGVHPGDGRAAVKETIKRAVVDLAPSPPVGGCAWPSRWRMYR